MDILPRLGVSCELSRAEFIRKLFLVNHEQVEQARESLFNAAVENGLADKGDALVKCKKCGVGKSVKEKHVEDIWTLVSSLVKNVKLPRVLLKSG